MITIIVDGKKMRVTKLQRDIIIATRLLGLLLTVVCAIGLGWVIISYFNVVVNNLSPETVSNIWDWNFFEVLFPVR